MYILHVDGSYNQKTDSAGYACVLFDNEKEIGVNFGENKTIQKKQNYEIYGLLQSLKYVIEKNITSVLIYNDCVTTVKIMNAILEKNDALLSKYNRHDFIIEEIKECINKMDSVIVHYINSKNNEADFHSRTYLYESFSDEINKNTELVNKRKEEFKKIKNLKDVKEDFYFAHDNFKFIWNMLSENSVEYFYRSYRNTVIHSFSNKNHKYYHLKGISNYQIEISIYTLETKSKKNLIEDRIYSLKNNNIYKILGDLIKEDYDNGIADILLSLENLPRIKKELFVLSKINKLQFNDVKYFEKQLSKINEVFFLGETIIDNKPKIKKTKILKTTKPKYLVPIKKEKMKIGREVAKYIKLNGIKDKKEVEETIQKIKENKIKL